MSKSTELITLAITFLFMAYIIFALFYNHSLFNNSFYFLTLVITFFYCSLLPFNKEGSNLHCRSYLQTGNTFAVIILILIIYISLNKNIINPPALIKSSLFSLGWTLFFLFGAYLFSILSDTFELPANKIRAHRITSFMFIMIFLILINLTAGVILSI